MPRKPTKEHPLRNIREAAGLTQKQLAVRIGVTKSTIQQVENGRMRMSHEAAVKIRYQPGCHIASKTDSDTGEKAWTVSATIVREDGPPAAYTSEDYEHWQEGLASAVTLLLQAATRAKQLPSVAFELEQIIGKIVDSHKLESHLAGGILRDNHGKVPEAAQVIARTFKVIPASTGLAVLRGCVMHQDDEDGE